MQYFNQAASKTENGPLWQEFSSRSAVNVEMVQYLHEWHNLKPEEEWVAKSISQKNDRRNSPNL